MNLRTLDYIRGIFKPYYENSGDAAHGISHADQVHIACYTIINRLERRGIILEPEVVTPLNIALAAYGHDMFAGTSRVLHHILANDWLRDNIVEKFGNLIPSGVDVNDVIETVASAVVEHRASYNGAYTTALSELLSAADRGVPDITSVIKRSYAYSSSKYTDESTIINETIRHIKAKYGRKGYGRFNNMYIVAYGNELSALRDSADKLTVKSVLNIIKGL